MEQSDVLKGVSKARSSKLVSVLWNVTKEMFELLRWALERALKMSFLMEYINDKSAEDSGSLCSVRRACVWFFYTVDFKALQIIHDRPIGFPINNINSL